MTILSVLSGATLCPVTCRSAETPLYDLVIYGGTSAGISAAVQAKRMGATVIVLEPSSRIGGLTTSGLGQTDIGNKAAIGGISREFYQRVRKHYAEDSNWNWETKASYRSGGQSRTTAGEDTMWTFEPSAALKIMQDLVDEHEIPVIRDARLDRTPLADGTNRIKGVVMQGTKIATLVTTNHNEYRGRCFIDATYEGDLLAGAGVSVHGWPGKFPNLRRVTQRSPDKASTASSTALRRGSLPSARRSQ